jgi:peptidoglycan hydrolase-like protein with peptidoglycan-binding domain
MPDVTSPCSRPVAPSTTATATARTTTPTPTTPPATPPATPPTPPPAPASDGFEDRASMKQKKAAEKALGAIGYHPGSADGRINASTRSAIKAFQKNRGLDVTGELDKRTYTAIRGVEKQKGKGVQTTGYVSAGVKKVEQRLKRLGYDVGKADGAYDQKTADAVKAFKADQKMKNSSGSLGDNGRHALNNEVQALSHKPYRARVKNTAAHKAADKVASREAKKQGGIAVGDRGPAVSTIQRHLRSAGFDPKSTRGVFDERTQGMVKEFQKKSGMEPTGKVGAATWKKLRQAQMEAKNATSPHQTKGEKSGAVKATERRLKKLGFNPGKVDGLYDSKTQKALDKFRKSYGLGGQGQGVGPATLKALKHPPANTNTVKGCAQYLLRSKNVSFWTGLSTGSDRKNLERLARGEKSFVPATGGYVTPKLSMMQALVDMAKRGPIMINALTGGSHSPNSNHYHGTADDLDLSTGNASMIAAVARQHGGLRNYETSHIHLDF